MSRVLAPLVRLPWRSIPLRPFLARRSYSIPHTETVPESKTDHPVVNEATAGESLRIEYAQKYLGKPAPEGVKLVKAQLYVKVEGRPLGFRYMLLRDACKCNLCVDEHSKQRKFRTTDIPPMITPREVEWNGKELQIRWASDIEGWGPDHVSKYDMTRRDHRANPPSSDTGKFRRRFYWGKQAMTANQHWVSYDDYMNDQNAFVRAMRYLALMGIIFVKDIPHSREMVEKIATRMGPLRNTFYGPTWDVRSVPQAKNVAYTNVFLGFHMDLMYMNEPPGFQLLHCLENSCDGGESLFVDSFGVAEDLRRKYPESFKDLTKLHLNYEYNHKEHAYNNSWPVVEVEDGDPTKPIVHVNYSPPFQAPLISNPYLHPHWNEYRRALARFTNEIELESNVFQLKLNPGECVIFENRRILHARNKFNTEQGQRWLAGAYVDEDAVLSTFRTSRDAARDVWYEKRDEWSKSAIRAKSGGQATAENKGTE